MLEEKTTASILIIYSSVDGQTEKICSYIKEKSKDKNNIKIININSINDEKIDKFKKIILGASIRYGKHDKKVYSFVKKNKELLDQKKSAFFSVNVVARKEEKNSPSTNPYVLKFLRQTKWSPNLVNVFAGKVNYPIYGIFDKLIIKLIMFITKGPTDTSMAYELTNWQKVQQFSQEIENL